MPLSKKVTNFSVIYFYISCTFGILIGLRPASELFWQLKFFGVNFQALLSLLIFLIAVFLIFTRKTIHRRFLPLCFAVFFYSLYIAIFSIFNGDVAFLEESLKTTTSLVIGLAILISLNRKQIQITILFFSISIFLLTVVSYLQHYGFYEFHYFTGSVISGQLVGRVSGGLSHPNDLNRSLIFMVYIILFRVIKTNHILSVGCLVFVLLPIYWSFHRTTYLSSIVIFVLYLIYEKRYVFLVISSVIASFLIMLNTEYLKWFIFEQRLNFGNGFKGSRFYFSYESIRLYLQAEFYNKLFGSGFFPGGRRHGDGDLPRIIYAYGVTGFIGYLSLLLSMFYAATRKTNRYAFFSMFCLFCIWIIYSTFVDITRYPAFLIMFFVCMRGSLLVVEEKVDNA
jgi:hypothetical protein